FVDQRRHAARLEGIDPAPEGIEPGVEHSVPTRHHRRELIEADSVDAGRKRGDPEIEAEADDTGRAAVLGGGAGLQPGEDARELAAAEMGRASCRERVERWGGAA